MWYLVSPVQWILKITGFWEMTPCGLVESYRISEFHRNLFPPSSGLIKVICSHQFSHRPGNIPPIPKLCTLIPHIFQAVFFAVLVLFSRTIRCHILGDNNLNADLYLGFRSSSSGMWCSVVLWLFLGVSKDNSAFIFKDTYFRKILFEVPNLN